MLGRIATAFGYVKAPKATFMLKHPVKGGKALVAAKGAKALFTTRAGMTLAAMIALPIAALVLKGRNGSA